MELTRLDKPTKPVKVWLQPVKVNYHILENNWDCKRDLIGQKPMVYYTGKPIEKGIQTTSHT